ncbi:unnamed protein product [Rotaria socialis]|uniref:Uncharacterized protein n=1 Tax=Rotaria socialis TaxID=392032 RepID=A0A818L994_9BILA|nr:unnamed protein product [Rotaria socialis]CAF3577979.1 unnamed protein product [Rotaria socialis]CAF4595074.1 unnamed protein product [Rotaria socialis]CAF4967914.1 unnamed protein product [Rotaria socialis]
MNISLVESQCLGGKLPDTVNVAIQIDAESTIDYLDPRPEYIRVIIIEWPTKFSISIARTVSLDNQYSSRLLNAQRCENFDD